MSGTLKDRVLEYIGSTDYVSFAELANRFGDHFKGGEHCIELRHNLVLWAGMSAEAATAMRELLNDKEIAAQPSSMWVYLADGSALTFPIAKRVRTYTKPHWAPVTLRPAKATAA